jgi:hypothetical protein
LTSVGSFCELAKSGLEHLERGKLIGVLEGLASQQIPAEAVRDSERIAAPSIAELEVPFAR